MQITTYQKETTSSFALLFILIECACPSILVRSLVSLCHLTQRLSSQGFTFRSRPNSALIEALEPNLYVHISSILFCQQRVSLSFLPRSVHFDVRRQTPVSLEHTYVIATSWSVYECMYTHVPLLVRRFFCFFCVFLLSPHTSSSFNAHRARVFAYLPW